MIKLRLILKPMSFQQVYAMHIILKGYSHPKIFFFLNDHISLVLSFVFGGKVEKKRTGGYLANYFSMAERLQSNLLDILVIGVELSSLNRWAGLEVYIRKLFKKKKLYRIHLMYKHSYIHVIYQANSMIQLVFKHYPLQKYS